MTTPLLRLFLALTATCCAEPVAYPLFYESPDLFRHAITVADEATQPLSQKITGITVPHHLLAVDMMATTFRLASAQKPTRIVVMSPDHYRRGTTLVSTTTRTFQTPLGNVEIDLPAVRAILHNNVVSESNLFSHEHGIQALLPFIHHYFPDIPIIPLALDIRSRPADWPLMAAALKPIITPRTLVIQSTDFSHYLLQRVAALRDQETLRLLATGDAAGIAQLNQPDNLDSKACQWLQMTLQREVFGCAAPTVVDNRNAIRYGGRADEPRTTSYITQLYSREFIPTSALPGEAWYFGGDTHFGRHVAEVFADPARAARVRDAILAVTGGRPLVVNLEGVLLDQAPSAYQNPMRIGMDSGLAIRELKQLHVAAVTIANNHSWDFGKEARILMIRRLTQNGISVADHGAPLRLGPFLLAADTDVLNLPEPAKSVLTARDFEIWKNPVAGAPLFAFLHCGTEYANSPGARERQLAGWAEDVGASLILGCHPHRPSPGWERTAKSLRFASLGNLIFDQADSHNSGGLIEVRFFEQGTWAARWLPLANPFAGHATP